MVLLAIIVPHLYSQAEVRRVGHLVQAHQSHPALPWNRLLGTNIPTVGLEALLVLSKGLLEVVWRIAHLLPVDHCQAKWA